MASVEKYSKFTLPVMMFLGGSSISLLWDIHKSTLDSPQKWALLIGLCAVVAFVILFILQIIGFVEFKSEFSKHWENANIIAEFIPDIMGNEGGATYDRIIKEIKGAKNSLLFLDYWFSTGGSYATSNPVRDKRRSYYDAIIQRILDQRDDKPFHKLLIQLEIDERDLKADTVYFEHIKRLHDLSQTKNHLTVFKWSKPCIRAHFLIIDDRKVIWPFLMSDPIIGKTQRYGAVIFVDKTGSFVEHLKRLCEKVDAGSSPFSPAFFSKNIVTEVTTELK